jgi:hypothetical protein
MYCIDFLFYYLLSFFFFPFLLSNSLPFVFLFVSIHLVYCFLYLTGPHGIDLKPGLVENLDYNVLPQVCYDQLHTWYGGNGPHFPRQVISLGNEAQVRNVYVCERDR